MIAVLHFADEAADFAQRAQDALAMLSERPGYLRGSLGRSIDDPTAWLLLTEWANVGSYRRALGDYDVKVHAAPLLAKALDIAGVFEALREVAPGGGVTARTTDREPLP